MKRESIDRQVSIAFAMIAEAAKKGMSGVSEDEVLTEENLLEVIEGQVAIIRDYRAMETAL